MSVSRPYEYTVVHNASDRMINEYGAVGEMRTCDYETPSNFTDLLYELNHYVGITKKKIT
jgi:hypothetical protein